MLEVRRETVLHFAALRVDFRFNDVLGEEEAGPTALSWALCSAPLA